MILIKLMKYWIKKLIEENTKEEYNKRERFAFNNREESFKNLKD